MTSGMRRLAQMVYNMNTVKRVHRVRVTSGVITEGESAGTNNTFSLLTCDDDPNYDNTTDGTNVAECEPGARIIAVQLVMTTVIPDGRLLEWMIGKDPDGVVTSTNFLVSSLYTADVTANGLVLRKNVWTVGHKRGTSQRTENTMSINIPGKVLARAGRMEDGDVIRLAFMDDGGGTGNGSWYLRGRIITRGP